MTTIIIDIMGDDSEVSDLDDNLCSKIDLKKDELCNQLIIQNQTQLIIETI